MPTSSENPERRKPDHQEADLDIPTYLRQQREEGVKPQRRKVRERLSPEEIRAAADAAPDAKPKTKEVKHTLDQYDFDESYNTCKMAMVIHLRDDGKVGFVSPHMPLGPPDIKEDLRRFFNESFKYAQPNQFFVFFGN